ncbi:ATP synthase epsilon chain [Cucumis melo var. makuwa]|uniref:ATP synthase epsilon chain n=1 Tax=Cucumis melo var. makuwa TaxID=1194695 RepID=A0A5A7TWU1_CUCMM|nr:ATP synthase epsilon chain [Cucumis melo var. makuwa]TYK06537.1 ATP synthase epsilon chain [Cucumis melo var. makuwa]
MELRRLSWRKRKDRKRGSLLRGDRREIPLRGENLLEPGEILVRYKAFLPISVGVKYHKCKGRRIALAACIQSESKSRSRGVGHIKTNPHANPILSIAEFTSQKSSVFLSRS